ncbi:MAG TPA: 2-oxoacid:acceptor oxidoreductase subunit alpha [Anaerolineaceae bacterium]|nr:2-oxoacid:acceptor oxidoreductase subunit alpha [Anaerolineaceae bacterium]
MTQYRSAPASGSATRRESGVNDFCITISTINGSGSATANTTLLRALFRMGIPVSGKNIFPSNIKGLPTWYTIRLSKDGYLARLEHDDIVIAMNPATITEELRFLVPGGVVFYPDDLKIPIERDDVIAYPMPVKALVKDADVPSSLRDYIANMVYVGVLAEMIGIDQQRIYEALDFHFKGKQKPIDSNLHVIQAAAQWARENLVKRDSYRVEPMNGTEGYVMADGNTAAALGALYGGVQFAGWYPITPASSLAEAIIEYAPEFRKDPVTGKDTVAIVQAEDELAAIGMAVGAGWGGLRSMTSSSGPGISLMSEYLGLAYYAEVPVVIWDVQRVGPSTGLPTRTAQGDLTFTYFISHGDTNFVLLMPGSVTECFEFGWKAFDLAERLQTPVIVLSDLDLGMNQWMAPKFNYPDQPMDRGKVLWEEDFEQMIGKTGGHWGRYMDIDGDGIPYRTLMGNRHPSSAYFARGTGHDEMARYSEDPEVWEAGLARLAKKFETAKQFVPKPVIDTMDGAKVGIIAFGSADPAVIESRDQMADDGLVTDYLRLRAIPFSEEVDAFINTHERIYVVELNQQGQLRQLLSMNYPEAATKFVGLAHMDGLPLTARWIRERIESLEEA